MAFEKLKKKIQGKTSDGSVPNNQKLYSQIKSEAKAKFGDDWPSAYGSAWLSREYKKRGGGYR
jgi:hypothetical protein